MLERQTRALSAWARSDTKNGVCAPRKLNLLAVGLLLFGILGGVSWATGINLPQYPPQEGFTVSEVFPNLMFDQPVSIRSAPGETNRLFVVERTGRILVVTNMASPTASVFLDLQESVESRSIEAGLLGMAFHPGFATNGYFFVYRTANLATEELRPGFYDLVSRFQVSAENPNEADRGSETYILTQFDAETFHNAGDLAFGPDGYLYISVGHDAPAGEDRSDNLQAIDKGHFGGILRIDVDKRAENLVPNPHHSVTGNYLIPRDNPFIGATSYQGIAVDPAKVRTEFFAIGFRNPWRFSFHPSSGALVVGDVGNGLMEEVDVVVKGGNYGWPYFEADLGTDDLGKAPHNFESFPPAVKYWHGAGTNEGNCIIGGVFYTGDKIPQLKGKYLFADFRRGHIWAAESDGTNINSQFKRLTGMINPSSFGIDPRDGEVLITDLLNGKVMKLVYNTGETAPPYPKTLSETGAFASLTTLTPVSEFVPFSVNQPFWSDNAIKQRWFWPGDSGEKVSFDTNGFGNFPAGAVWMKHFELELKVGDPLSRRRLETRFLIKQTNGIYGVTYRWDASGNNATLVAEEGQDESYLITDGTQTRTQVWHFPSRNECRTCHSDAAGQALGFNIAQLNRPVSAGSENQLDTLQRAGYIELSETNYLQLPAMAARNDETASYHLRAKSFLAANCSFCHYGPNLNAAWDARFGTPFSQMNLGPLVDPSNTFGILGRLGHEDLLKMPPIGRLVLDTNAIALLTQWIGALPTKPWTDVEIGATPQEGISGFEPTRIAVSGSGTGPKDSPEDTCHFGYLAATNNSSAIVHLAGGNTSGSGGAGLMMRAGLGAESPFAFQGVSGGTPVVSYRARPLGATAFPNSEPSIPDAGWLRMTRKGLTINLEASEDGEVWEGRGSYEVSLGEVAYFGLSAYNDNVGRLNTAFFDQFSLISANLLEPADGSQFYVGERVRLNASGYSFPADTIEISYFANGELIGRATNGSSIFWWTNAVPGTYAVTAKAKIPGGNEVLSAPKKVQILPLPAKASIALIARGPLGDWKNDDLGVEGYLIPNVSTNFPATVRVVAPRANVYTWQNPSTDGRAVRLPGSQAAIANAWNGQELRLSLSLDDAKAHNVSFYCVDWKGDASIERVEIRDFTSGAVLATRVLTNLAIGKRITFQVIGEVEVVITPMNGGVATLSAVFVDAGVPHEYQLSLVAPAEGQEFTAPGPVPVEAALDAFAEGAVVSFYADEKLIGQATSPPYRILWDNASVGNVTISARASDGFGWSGVSEGAKIAIKAPSASAVFMGVDETTQGDWTQRYGTAGFQIPFAVPYLPTYADINSPGAFLTWSGDADLNEKRAIQNPYWTERYIAYLMDWRIMTNQINFTDGRAHLFSVYFLDGEYGNWEQSVRVKDGSGKILDERTISHFENGLYLTWSIRGAVTLEIERIFGVPVTSGFFIDEPPSAAASVQLIEPINGAKFSAGQDVLLRAVVDSAVAVRQVDFYASGNYIGNSAAAPYTVRWAVDVPGATLSARATLVDGSMVESTPAQIEVQADESGARVKFVGTDEKTMGNWRGNLGASGHWIPQNATNLPAFFDLELTNADIHVWDWDATDARALQYAAAPFRLASAVYATEVFEARLHARDEKWRRITFYLLDFDRIARAESVELLDTSEGILLDKQQVDSYSAGLHLSWLVRGDVTARLRASSGNAVLSGIFVDPVSNLEQWRLNQFGDLDDDRLGADDADPDGDGISNLFEYKFGLNPFDKDDPSLIYGSWINGRYLVSLQLNPFANDVRIDFEISNDLQNWRAAESRFQLHQYFPGQTIDSVQYEVVAEQDTAVFVRVRLSRLSTR